MRGIGRKLRFFSINIDRKRSQKSGLVLVPIDCSAIYRCYLKLKSRISEKNSLHLTYPSCKIFFFKIAVTFCKLLNFKIVQFISGHSVHLSKLGFHSVQKSLRNRNKQKNRICDKVKGNVRQLLSFA